MSGYQRSGHGAQRAHSGATGHAKLSPMTDWITTPEAEVIRAWCRAGMDDQLQAYAAALLYIPTEQMPGELAKLATLDKPDLLGLIERMMGYMLDTGMFYPVAEE